MPFSVSEAQNTVNESAMTRKNQLAPSWIGWQYLEARDDEKNLCWSMITHCSAKACNYCKQLDDNVGVLSGGTGKRGLELRHLLPCLAQRANRVEASFAVE